MARGVRRPAVYQFTRPDHAPRRDPARGGSVRPLANLFQVLGNARQEHPMYVDARKMDYAALGFADADSLVARDKEFAKNAYTEWLDSNLDAIVERQWQIDDIGVVERSGAFVKLLREAEFTYALGAYTSTLALVGVSTEDLVRFLLDQASPGEQVGSNFSRINKLHDLGVIDNQIKEACHKIRGLRNGCLHYDEAFKAKDSEAIRADALSALNLLKSTYGALMGAKGFNEVDGAQFSDLLEHVADLASSVDHGPNVAGKAEMQAKLRNLFASAFGIDLSLGDKPEVLNRISIFDVLELDGKWEPPELTLRDRTVGAPVVVDLSATELQILNKLGVAPGNVVAASLRSEPDELGMTTVWRLRGDLHILDLEAG